MSIARLATRPAATAPGTTTADDLARQMAEQDVGSIVITRGGKPVGIVTDRDLVLRVLLPRKDPVSVRADQVMTSKLECITADRQPLEALTLMQERGIRRLPVLGAKGELLGIITFDDLVRHVGSTTAETAHAISDFPGTAIRP